MGVLFPFRITETVNLRINYLICCIKIGQLIFTCSETLEKLGNWINRNSRKKCEICLETPEQRQ